MLLIEKELTGEILDSFFAVYNALGYGFLENPYTSALSIELQERGLSIRREVPVELFYRGKQIGFYRMDLLVNDKVLVEIKASEALAEAHSRQLFNYLRASKLQVGLLLNFGPSPKHKRIVWTGKRFVD